MANHHLKIIREMMNVTRLNQVLIALLSASVWWVILNILIAVVWISHLVKRVYRATTKVFFGFWPRNLLSKKELKSSTSASVLRILGMVLYRASAYTDKGIYVSIQIKWLVTLTCNATRLTWKHCFFFLFFINITWFF